MRRAVGQKRHIRSIIMLPFMALVVVPSILLFLTESLNVGWSLRFSVSLLPILGGVVLILGGLTLIISSVKLFMRYGDGTLAPWDKTKKLVIRGLYRYVRNPMHIGVFVVLYGEGLLLGSPPILIFVSVVVLLHLAYIPFIEERGLEHRFGEEYKLYKQNVRRWIPRLQPWDPPISQEVGSG